MASDAVGSANADDLDDLEAVMGGMQVASAADSERRLHDMAAPQMDNAAIYLRTECDRIWPTPEYLATDYLEFVGDKRAETLRWLGEWSFCRLIGEQLGGPGADAFWCRVADEEQLQLSIGRRVYDQVPVGTENNRRAQVGKWTTSKRRLLNPRQMQGWALLRATANELHVLAAALAVAATREELLHCLHKCWAWCAAKRLSPRRHPPHCSPLPVASSLSQFALCTPSPRDAHGMAHKFQKPWVVLMVLGSMVFEGEAVGVFAPSCNAVCAISMDHWQSVPRPTFYSLHPCAPAPEYPPLLVSLAFAGAHPTWAGQTD